MASSIEAQELVHGVKVTVEYTEDSGMWHAYCESIPDFRYSNASLQIVQDATRTALERTIEHTVRTSLADRVWALYHARVDDGMGPDAAWRFAISAAFDVISPDTSDDVEEEINRRLELLKARIQAGKLD